MTVPPLCAANKRKQIDQVVRYLEERLRELDEEKEELKKYQQLDKQRRSLEYTILDHELNDARNELASVRPAISVNFYTFLDAIFILLQQVEIIWIENEGRHWDWIWWSNHWHLLHRPIAWWSLWDSGCLMLWWENLSFLEGIGALLLKCLFHHLCSEWCFCFICSCCSQGPAIHLLILIFNITLAALVSAFPVNWDGFVFLDISNKNVAIDCAAFTI